MQALLQASEPRFQVDVRSDLSGVERVVVAVRGKGLGKLAQARSDADTHGIADRSSPVVMQGHTGEFSEPRATLAQSLGSTGGEPGGSSPLRTLR